MCELVGVPKVEDEHLWCPCWSWTKPLQKPCTGQARQQRLRERTGAGAATPAVRGERLCGGRMRTGGSPGRCTWLTPGAGLAAGWLRCRPFGIRQ